MNQLSDQPSDRPACRAAEAALLGAVLLAPQRAEALLDGLTGAHFTNPRHQAVLGAVRALLDAGVLPEPVAVHDYLLRSLRAAQSDPRRQGASPWGDRAPGVVLVDLMQAVTTPEAAPYWRDLLVSYAGRRWLIDLAVRLDQTAREANPDTITAVVGAGRALAAAIDTSSPSGQGRDMRVGIVRAREAA